MDYIDSLLMRKPEVIKREIKDFIWFFDRISKEIILYNKNDFEFFVIPVRQWFSLFRFIISAAQKLSTKLRNKTIIQ